MIGLQKSPLPSGVTITCENDYLTDPVYALLRADCHDKCYICEQALTSVNVEHRIPHKNKNNALKYAWVNLFLACSHCNNTKLGNYSPIIDPTKKDPEKLIKQSWSVDDDMREFIIVQKIAGGDDVDITVDLLNAVYNNPTTATKKLECQCLKNEISNKLLAFRIKLEKYEKIPNNSNTVAVEKELLPNSLFTAFKREIVRNKSKSAGIFAKYL
jgi:hypothetical protein